MEKLRAAVHLYPKFEGILRGMRRYDFDDMVLWVIDAFERLPFLLRNYQEHYLYFLVDEYQDTNGSQNKILSQLIGFWENPNIFIVGDDDQAIYEFQGARLKSLLDFYEVYKKQLKIILLKENYRSTQHVLDQAKRLIDSNNLRIINQLHDLDIDKNLVAKGGIAQSTIKPVVLEYANRFQEMVGIVQDIENLKTKGYSLPKIAIIYARHREAENIIGLLEKKGLPYQTKRRINILDTPLIQNFRMVLAYIAAEADMPYAGEPFLFKILNINFLDIQVKDILLLAKYISDTTQSISDEDLSLERIEKNAQTWRDTLNNLPKLGFKKGTQLKKISAFLNDIIQDTYNLPLLNWVEKCINQSGLLAWAQGQPNKILLLQTINTFFEFVKSETERKPRLTLNQLLTILNILDKNNLAIELVQNVQNRGGVVLTTAHSAKGLEFERVYVIDAVDSEWENAKSGSRNRFTLPDTLTFTTEEDATEARRRLFYVAMTRAKEYLQISYAKADEKGKALSQSQFVDELSSERKQGVLAENILLDNQFTQLGETVKIDAELIENEYVKDVLKDFKLSVSALNIYLECPLSFYFEYILKIPSTMSEAARYGSAMHYALRKLFGEMLRAKDKQFPSKAEFIQFFEVDMHIQKNRFSTAAFDRRLSIGRENLSKIYDQNVEKWSKNVVVERSIAAECEGVPIKGVIDKIEFKDDGTVHIVDYKTGKMQPEQVSKFTVRKPLGGQYWRQLVFYKLLYENYRANLVRVKSGEISYLEPDTKGIFKTKVLDIEPQDAQILRGVIVETWGKIQDNQFDGCGKKDCVWCNFVRNNQTVDSFRNIAVEDLDE
jgi:DNA helicase II / ATP-dependent DNA helicase PcrA